MPTCANCEGSFLFGGAKEGEHRFCSDECHSFWRFPGFCESCADSTTDEGIGGTFTMNFLFGTILMGFGAACPTCNSKVKRKWFIFLLPLFPVSKPYRVLYCNSSQYLSRKIIEH